MTWRFQPDAMPNGLTATPRELNAILRAYAEEMSGHIDRDNVDNKVVTAAKFVTGAIRQVVSYPEPGETPSTVTLTIPKRTTSTGWQPVWAETITTGEGWIDMKVNATSVPTAGTCPTALQIAIAIDDVIIAESPPYAASYNDGGATEAFRACLAVVAAAPVQAGAHRVQLLANLRADTNTRGAASEATVTLPGYWVCVVEHIA